MKRSIQIVSILIMILLVIVLVSCEYEVAEPEWKDVEEGKVIDPPEPRITGVDPADVAPAGINYISISGENFAEAMEDNYVYFDNVLAEIVNSDASTIRVRRPNIAKDSTTVKVVSYDALVVAKHSPYRVDTVMVRYGGFIDNALLASIAVDNDENLYVIQNADSLIYQVDSSGNKSDSYIAKASGVVSDATVSRDGRRLIMLRGDSLITQLDLENLQEDVVNEVTEWASLWQWEAVNDTDSVKVGISVTDGDIDSEGNLYTGGIETGLYVITEGDTTGGRSLGVYEEDRITYIRIYNNDLYVMVNLAGPSTQPNDFAIWRHSISGGDIGSGTVVFDKATALGDFANSTISAFEILANGLILIGSNNDDPILIHDPESLDQDILYKGIIPSSCEQLLSGTGSYLYMILAGEENNIIRLDIGTMGAE